MDGLALLCTLHADGPATLKRLRRAGCTNLGALLARPVNEVAEALDAAPAAARRLLREARLLADRVGPELEAEEAPPVGAPGAGLEAAGLDLPPVTAGAALDRTDRALLARIVRDAAAVPVAEAPTELERLGVDLGTEGAAIHTEPVAPFDVEAPAGTSPGASAVPASEPTVASGEQATDAEPVQVAEPSPPAEPETAAVAELAPRDPGAAFQALDGVDAEFAAVLVKLGYSSLGALAAADTLALRRELGVTFAQAKRLTFLARRAATQETATEVKAPLPAAPAPRLTPGPSGLVEERAMPPATPRVVEPAPRATPVAPSSVEATSVHAAPPGSWRIEPRTAPLAPPSEAAASASPAPVSTTVPSPRPALARAAFWEPRHHLASHGAAEPQGVLVDPAEVSRPRRFTEARRATPAPVEARSSAAAAPRRAEPAAGAASDQHAPDQRLGARPTGGAARAGTTLGWNFEIPRPEPAQPVDDDAPRRAWRPLEADESSAGPFA